MTGWRPLPQPGGDAPRHIGRSLDRYRSSFTALLSRWPEVVGEGIAGHARPVAVRDGALVVQVDDPAWATQLRWLGPDLLQRLAEAVGEPVAERLEVRVARS